MWLALTAGPAAALDEFARGARERGVWIVQRGDTLFSIVRRLVPDDRAAHARIRAALVESNREAFGASISELKTGAELRLPDELILRRAATGAGRPREQRREPSEPAATAAAITATPDPAPSAPQPQPPARPTETRTAAAPTVPGPPSTAFGTRPTPAATDEPSLRTRISGNVAARYDHFTQSPRFDEQPDFNAALLGEIEYYLEAESGSSFTVKPYARTELQDGGDTFVDLREAMFLTFGDDWELRAGIGKVFWGVTESVHLVDIVNQTDFREDRDGEEKLGQPMLHYTLLRDWGTLGLFVLPYFRERELPDADDRPGFGLDVEDDAQFESDDEERHVGGALRYTHTLDEIDLGLSYFNGTSREPRLAPNTDGDALVAFYPLIEQYGLDVQYTSEAWLWKLETIYREDDIDGYVAAAGGFEYTFVGLFETAQDLGVIGEYLYDDRGDEATGPFQNDALIGLRWVLNDEQSTEALFGVIADLDGGGQALNLEASRRLGESFKLSVEARSAVDTDDDPQLDGVGRDDVVRFELGYFF